jgi:hypothetical protein
MRERPSPDDPLATFLVERYWPGVTADVIRSSDVRLHMAVEEMNNQGTPVRYIRSTLIPEEETVFSLFSAPSAGQVAEANQRSGVPFDRIVEATEINHSANPEEERPMREKEKA